MYVLYLTILFFLFLLSVGVLFICGISGIAAVTVQIPMLAIYFYVVLLLCGLSVPVVNAATVEQYPTRSRAMAICITLMMGRLGSVVGANIVGLLLDNYCQLAFSLSGACLIGMAFLILYIIESRLKGLFIGCGFLALLIPNIRERACVQKPRGPMESRHSIC